MKICTACKVEKRLSEFHKQPEGKYGVRSVCKTCRARKWELQKERHSIWKKEHYAKNKERIKAKAQEWKEANREKHNQMSMEWFYKNRDRVLSSKRAYRKANKEQISISIKRWKAANPEALRDYFHARKAALKRVGGRHTRFQIAELLVKQKGLCAICKANIEVVRHRDHIVPISAGGSNDISNIQLLCPTCNLAKRAKSMDEYLKEIHGPIRSGSSEDTTAGRTQTPLCEPACLN